MPNARTSVFISYSHADIAWLRLLNTHLKPLTRDQKVEIWSDQKIRKGARWREQIHKQLAMARVGIFLVSADFLASDFIHAEELPPLLKAAEREGATLLTVVVRPCAGAFKDSPLYPLQAMNGPDSPLSGMSKTQREQIMASVYDELRTIFRVAAPKRVIQAKTTKPTAAAPKVPKRVTGMAADKTGTQEAAAKARTIARQKAIAKKKREATAAAKKLAAEQTSAAPKKATAPKRPAISRTRKK
ncbi:MAG: toll/interleukin-1 receptor domain-containing protein [Janthinobacterium lividum]